MKKSVIMLFIVAIREKRPPAECFIVVSALFESPVYTPPNPGFALVARMPGTAEKEGYCGKKYRKSNGQAGNTPRGFSFCNL